MEDVEGYEAADVDPQLHIMFLPFMLQGHLTPILDMVKLFASKGLRTTVVISIPSCLDTVQKARAATGLDIGLRVLQLSDPHTLDAFDMSTLDIIRFHKALPEFRRPLEQLLEELRPDCLVSDMFFPWTVDSAAKFGIPRLLFHVSGYFSLCASEQMRNHKPFKTVSSDSEPFVLPGLPHQFSFVRTQVDPNDLQEKADYFFYMMQEIRDSESRSYGTLVNTFYELEPDYVDHYRNVLGRKAWNIGPLLFFNNVGRKESTSRLVDEHGCLTWLDTKTPNSVIYVCFGSMVNFTPTQLHEIARGLEMSGHNFIWVVRKGMNEDKDGGWLPRNFIEKTRNRGLMIIGWVPQVVILNHPSTGAFMTHCGWNSTLEGVCAGVPMVTWPLYADQFYIEKVVTEVLRIGIPVGNKKWQMESSEGVGGEAVGEAVQVVMAGESAPEMRSRAMYYKGMARKAVEKEGSSSTDLNALIQELKAYKNIQN